MRVLAEKVKDAEQDRLLKMEAEKVAMIRKLQDIEENKVVDSAPKFHLNKRQKKQLEKIKRDPELSDA